MREPTQKKDGSAQIRSTAHNVMISSHQKMNSNNMKIHMWYVHIILNQTVNTEEKEKMKLEDVHLNTPESAFTSKQIAAKKVTDVISFM